MLELDDDEGEDIPLRAARKLCVLDFLVTGVLRRLSRRPSSQGGAAGAGRTLLRFPSGEAMFRFEARQLHRLACEASCFPRGNTVQK